MQRINISFRMQIRQLEATKKRHDDYLSSQIHGGHSKPTLTDVLLVCNECHMIFPGIDILSFRMKNVTLTGIW